MRDELWVYCAHCSVNNEIQPVEWGESPTSIEYPPTKAGERCVHHIYKDVADTPGRRLPPRRQGTARNVRKERASCGLQSFIAAQVSATTIDEVDDGVLHVGVDADVADLRGQHPFELRVRGHGLGMRAEPVAEQQCEPFVR